MRGYLCDVLLNDTLLDNMQGLGQKNSLIFPNKFNILSCFIIPKPVIVHIPRFAFSEMYIVVNKVIGCDIVSFKGVGEWDSQELKGCNG